MPERMAVENVDADELTIHSDQGPAMKSHMVAQLLATLGVTKSHSRPYVSNDNPFSESPFKTLKYRPMPVLRYISKCRINSCLLNPLPMQCQ